MLPTVSVRRTPGPAALAAAGLGVLVAAALLTSAPVRADPGGVLLALVLPVAFTVAGVLTLHLTRASRPGLALLGVGGGHLAAFGLATLVPRVSPGWAWLPAATSLALFLLGFVAVLVLFAVFPDGSFRRPWERRLVATLTVAAVALPVAAVLGAPQLPLMLQLPGLPEFLPGPQPVPALAPLAALAPLPLIAPVLAAVLFALRYRDTPPTDRDRLRWPLLALVIAAAALGGYFLLGRWLPAGLGEVFVVVTMAVLPAAVFLALAGRNKVDVEVALRRALVLGPLWLLITAGYAGSAAALGLTAGARSSGAGAVLVAVGAAVVLTPARRRLQAWADRVALGRRPSRHDLLRQVGAAVADAYDPQALAARTASTVHDGLDATWVQVTLGSVTGSAGRPGGPATLTVPVGHGGADLGEIRCGRKRTGVYTRGDRDLLGVLARQAGLAGRNLVVSAELAVRLAELNEQARELTDSRRRIVQAADGERRRIERDLHDGVQQEIVAMLARLELARTQLSRDPDAAERTLAGLQEEARHTIGSLRDFVRGVHPAVLSDRGLVEAVLARAEQLPLAVQVEADDAVRTRRFPPAVEGAAYFLVTEALTNVLKHAPGHPAVISLHLHAEHLVVQVGDSGPGLGGAPSAGSGLEGLRDRVAALGGTLTVSTGPGTTVCGRLPVGRP